MPTPADTQGRLGLKSAVYGFVFVTLLAVSAGLVAVALTRSGSLVDDALDSAVRLRADAAGQVFARRLESDWDDLTYLAERIPDSGAAETRGLLDGTRGDGTRISWIGYADLSGEVLAATGGMLEGQDVSSRPWFRNGLQGSFAGDVHDAVLLADLLQSEGAEPMRFIDLARPVTDATGEVIGVVGMHIDFAWARDYFIESAGMMGIDLYLIGAGGDVVVSTDATPDAEELQILQAARSGALSAGREVWPDGREYFSTLVPTVTYGDLPSFGWRIVGRLDAQTFQPTLSWLAGAGAVVVACLVVLLAGSTAIFVHIFIRPFQSLSQVAGDIADGRDVYPPDWTSSREAAELSAALARLQREGREEPEHLPA